MHVTSQFQEEAIHFLANTEKAIVLAGVGAGKTRVALKAMQLKLSLENKRVLGAPLFRFLVVAPKRVCLEVWPQETQKWLPEFLVKIYSLTENVKNRKMVLNKAHDQTVGVAICLINYELLPWLAEQDFRFDGVVFDELTKLKNTKGVRFKAVEKIIKDTPIRWGLTGSFTSNGLEDVFGQCRIIDNTLLGKGKTKFLEEYFICLNRDFGLWEPKPNALKQVMDKVKRATITLDNEKYQASLPDLNLVEIRSPLINKSYYNKIKKEYLLEHEGQEISAINAATCVMKLQQMASGFAYTDEGQTIWFSKHKLDLLEEILNENQGAPTLVVYNFKAELEALKTHFANLATLDDKNAVALWNAGKTCLLAIHPKAAGHGLNLQYGGARMVFMSLPWSLELFEQTIGRLHRSGQKNKVWCYLLLTKDTVDEKIYVALKDKKNVSDYVLKILRGEE